MARVIGLERWLGLNSPNTSKPPSSYGLGRPPRTGSLRAKTGKKPGGHEGHKGGTLAQTAAPDRVVDHCPETCPHRGAIPDKTASLGYRPRQVFDVPEPRPLRVTEHRAHTCGCPDCGAQIQAAFPADVTAPVQYGTRITALAVYLRDCHLVPEGYLKLFSIEEEVCCKFGTMGGAPSNAVSYCKRFVCN